ncbi:LacI family transcriptional regulator [Microbacterium sp. CFH 31415]|uniref:LacI family DNA-binding transcriptional regulator n=1 Tax=Microbacterium sp. CFH 31415 TaxID=2921732 RepID=UPI001F1299B9|nr:LacI family DNA-binding transcriptional regulator [Microbacterium sp. CFH 31415]MCH6231532.1 LacI family transcriptional regulator [Microbacterium sp. CFH 31415]
MSETHTPARGAATLHDVAREAGVSLATASRVLNGSTRKVADSYRERVAAAAEKLGYTANLSAQATARGTSAIVALLVADIGDVSFGRLASGVVRGAEEAGLIVTIADTGRDPERELRLVRTLRGQRPRGLILGVARNAGSGSAALHGELTALAAMGCHVVVLGEGEPGHRSISLGNRGGAEALGAELAELGYRDAVVVGGPEGLRASDDRIGGFTAGFTAGGGTIGAVRHGATTRDAGYAAAGEVLADGLAEGTLIFGVSDLVAAGVASALRDAGRRVGADIAVAGFDDIPTCRDIGPGLTTVRAPFDALGYRALRAAVESDWQGDAEAPLALEVVVRGSTPRRDGG